MIAAIPLTLMFVLALTSSASAECAWVLWSNFISSNPVSRHQPATGGLWTPESAGTRMECERARDRMRAGAVENAVMGPGTQALPSGDGSVGVVGPNGQTVLTCLPDTIDPRGPKER